MESTIELEAALQSLQLQIAEGVDEWILPRPQSRFAEAETTANAKGVAAGATGATAAPDVTPPSTPATSEASAPKAIDFAELSDDDAILDALLQALPAGLQGQFENPVPALGDVEAEIVVITDPPFREAVAAGNLEGDASIRLLLKSLEAIDLGIDTRKGKEPRARIRMLPISPWRMPQDRKFVDAEAKIFRDAIKARIGLAQHKIVFLAGSNIANIERDIEEGKLFGMPAKELVSPRAMLREPLLKRVHWQRLLDVHAQLESDLAI